MSVSPFFQRIPALEPPIAEDFFLPTCPLHQVSNFHYRKPWWVTKKRQLAVPGKGAEGSKEISFSACSEHWNPISRWPHEPKKAAPSSCWSERLQSHLCDPGATGTPQARLGMGWHEGMALLFSSLRTGFGWACFRWQKKWETHSVKTLLCCGWTFLDNCCPRVPPLSIPFILTWWCAGKPALQQRKEKALICSICQFPWCKYSYLGYQPGAAEYGVGKTGDMCVIVFRGPAGTRSNTTTQFLNSRSLKGCKIVQNSTVVFLQLGF